MARDVKSNFRASRIVLVKYMSSVCALAEDICKNVNLDRQHPFLASIRWLHTGDEKKEGFGVYFVSMGSRLDALPPSCQKGELFTT